MHCVNTESCPVDWDELDKAAIFPVIEIFQSIQGEGHFMGLSVTFVRFAGCNLRCSFCDTKESWHPKHIKNLNVTQLVEEVQRTSGGHSGIVVLTGGEPCLQKNLSTLIKALHLGGYTVNIETNGTLPAPYNADWVTVSPKPPEYMIHPCLRADELKFVVTEDFDAKKAIPEDLRQQYCTSIWLQPDGTDRHTMETAWRRCYELTMDDPKLRVGVQLHKLMEVQ